MPLEVSDDIRICLYDAQPGGMDFHITGISEQAVSVTPRSDTQAAETTYLWEKIARIETLKDKREIFQSGD